MPSMEQWQEPGQLTGGDDMHGTYVERTVRELQNRVAQAEKELAGLQTAAAAAPVALPSAAASLAVMAAAYEAATQADPFLPFPDSVLPALLALRTSHEVLAASKVYLEKGGTASVTGGGPPMDETQARRQLAAEQVRRDDQCALQTALEARVAALRSGGGVQTTTAAVERRQARVAALQTATRTRDRDTAALLRALKSFLHGRLGPMLAAEERGGPVVGSAVDDEALGLGLGVDGARRKRAAGTGVKRQKKMKHDSRQRRLEDMWGGNGYEKGDDEEENGDEDRDEEEDDENEEMDDGDDDDGDDDDDNDDNDDRAAATAASTEMQEVTEQLLNTLVEAGSDAGSAYVSLSRESAAARFLVRAKVAQFHPRDATRLRLVDFGRDLDD